LGEAFTLYHSLGTTLAQRGQGRKVYKAGKFPQRRTGLGKLVRVKGLLKGKLHYQVNLLKAAGLFFLLGWAKERNGRQRLGMKGEGVELTTALAQGHILCKPGSTDWPWGLRTPIQERGKRKKNFGET